MFIRIITHPPPVLLVVANLNDIPQTFNEKYDFSQLLGTLGLRIPQKEAIVSRSLILYVANIRGKRYVANITSFSWTFVLVKYIFRASRRIKKFLFSLSLDSVRANLANKLLFFPPATFAAL